MKFRKDINGLRAIAVMAVMLYHFGVSGFGGGFAGVDVFFVVSGFLMTSIIVNGLSQGTFSTLGFYMARAKRIVPALAVLCFTLLSLGWFLLPSIDYAQLGEHALTSLTFVSNFIYQGEEGYFDTLSQDKWLLHTWSLSVEWQFYLLYPLLLVGLFRKKEVSLKKLEKVLLVLAGIFFVVSVATTPTEGAFAFYLLPARIWELVAGGLAFLWAKRISLTDMRAQVMHGVGLALILISVMLFDHATPWPGHAALLPVLGSVLILFSARQSNPLLSNMAAQKLGSWSYSIYLWHWPVWVALRYGGVQGDVLWLSGGVVCSVLLGALSYGLIETPVRRRPAKAIVVALFCIPCAFGAFVHAGAGMPARLPAHVRVIEKEVIARNRDILLCAKGKGGDSCAGGDIKYFVWGDSHAPSVFTAVRSASGDARGVLYTKSCPPLLNASVGQGEKSKACRRFIKEGVEKISSLSANVPLVMAFRFSYYLHGYNENPEKDVSLYYTDVSASDVRSDPAGVFSKRLVETLCLVAEKHPNIYVVEPVPEMGIDVPRKILRDLMLWGRAEDVTLSLNSYRERHSVTMAALHEARDRCGVKLLNTAAYLCKGGVCLGSVDHRPYYVDDDHLSERGNRLLVPMLRQAF